MSIDKSTRQHYAMQGGGPNYLGKQKMVKAPKKWLSSPDHEPAELAYITKKEKDILLDLNIYGSLKNGKPNRGPSGIMSLQGDMGGWGGGGGGSGNSSGGGGGGQDRMPVYSAPRPAPAPSRPTMADIAGPTPSGISPQQSIAMTGGIGSAGKSQKEVQAAIDSDKASRDLGTSLHGGETVKEAIRKADIKNMIKSQQEEKYDVPVDPTKFGETVEGPDLRTQKEKDEAWENAQDWDKIDKLNKKGHSFKEIQKAMEKGLLTKADPQSIKTNLFSRGINSLRNLIPETRLENSLLSGLKKSFAPTTGGMFDPKNMALGALKRYGMKKLGLGALNPWLGLLSFLPQLFGKKAFDPFKSLTNKFAKKPKDMSAGNKLGLYTDRFPTQTTDTLTARGPRTTAQKIATGETDLAKLIKGKDTGGKSIMEDFYANQGSWSERLGDQLGINLQEAKVTKQDLARYTPRYQKGLIDAQDYDSAIMTGTINKDMSKYEFEQMKKGKITEPGTYKKTPEGPVAVAYGGRIDSPLMGRRRDI